MRKGSPLFWPVAELVEAYRSRALSPVEVAEEGVDRIAAFDAQLHSFLTVTADAALEQARNAESRFREGSATPPLLGVPTSLKDLFAMRGAPTTLGSLVYRGRVASEDSAVVAALRTTGATFIGKTNTAEFGQSATTENLLSPGCRNPWDSERTAGGSSGGAAASVAAGLAAVALGSDGGGSIRIPAALCGLFGLKPTFGGVYDDGPFRAMSDFACPGPIVRRVADARPFLGALMHRAFPRAEPARLRIAWCAQPEGRPVEPGVARATATAVRMLAELGHVVSEVELPIYGWKDAFGPLVLADEWRYRRHLLSDHANKLTAYARRSIEAAADVTEADIVRARALAADIRRRVAALLERYDLIVTPATAAVAFPIGKRPAQIAGQDVDALWGAFPFTAAFNVAGTPATSLPCGLSDGLPVGLQVVGPRGGEALLLDLCEELEEALGFPADEMAARWAAPQLRIVPGGDASVERRGTIAVVRISRPQKRNALSLELLGRLRAGIESKAVRDAAAAVLTGDKSVFSAGADLDELGRGLGDLGMDEAIAAVADAISSAPVPFIAAVEGPCIGAGLELAAACDVVIAGDSSTFSLPAAKLGILYRPSAVRQLVWRLGYQTTARLLVFGERMSANEALTAGIASRVVPRGGALEAALELAGNAGPAVRRAAAATKALLRTLSGEHGADLDPWEALRRDLLETRGARSTRKERQSLSSLLTRSDQTIASGRRKAPPGDEETR
jgi:Asp-tRNA(Asn)/Glu-tRNA(Gln) amidotransferase A subunit family amidase/enoyl-CoA hydratase/carnithine racemase